MMSGTQTCSDPHDHNFYYIAGHAVENVVCVCKMPPFLSRPFHFLPLALIKVKVYTLGMRFYILASRNFLITLFYSQPPRLSYPPLNPPLTTTGCWCVEANEVNMV